MDEGAEGWDEIREAWRAAVAHDLRGPVVTVDLAARLLLEDPSLVPSPEGRAIIARIARAASRLDRMVQDLAAAMSLEGRQVRLERRAVDLPSLIREITEGIDRPADRPLTLRSQAPVPEVSADPEHLGRILEHLLLNALKYGRAGTAIAIDVEPAGETVVVSVTNEGPGIDPDEMGRIYDRFYRGALGARMEAEGLGLGLYVARGLVEAHGGSLWAESRPGATTVFRFSMPTVKRLGDRPPPP
jgi:signal transduction histidine kinase